MVKDTAMKDTRIRKKISHCSANNIICSSIHFIWSNVQPKAHFLKKKVFKPELYCQLFPVAFTIKVICLCRTGVENAGVENAQPSCLSRWLLVWSFTGFVRKLTDDCRLLFLTLQMQGTEHTEGHGPLWPSS